MRLKDAQAALEKDHRRRLQPPHRLWAVLPPPSGSGAPYRAPQDRDIAELKAARDYAGGIKQYVAMDEEALRPRQDDVRPVRRHQRRPAPGPPQPIPSTTHSQRARDVDVSLKDARAQPEQASGRRASPTPRPMRGTRPSTTDIRPRSATWTAGPTSCRGRGG